MTSQILLTALLLTLATNTAGAAPKVRAQDLSYGDLVPISDLLRKHTADEGDVFMYSALLRCASVYTAMAGMSQASGMRELALKNFEVALEMQEQAVVYRVAARRSEPSEEELRADQKMSQEEFDQYFGLLAERIQQNYKTTGEQIANDAVIKQELEDCNLVYGLMNLRNSSEE